MLDGNQVVLLDVDDVVCRCVQGMANEAGKKLGVEISEDDVKTWDFHDTIDGPGLKEHIEEKMSEKGWCLSLEPFPGAIEGVKRLMTIAEIFFVTAPFHGEHWMHERRSWLYSNFGVDRDRVIQGHSKFLVRGDVFVDDKVENLVRWEKYGRENNMSGVPVLWDRPHNRLHPGAGSLYRIGSWGQLYDFVKRGPRGKEEG
jgi:5'(3')-deoxyribonucleotidase